jgi:hypothetical protein
MEEKKKKKKILTQNEKHNEPHRTCLSLLPKANPIPLISPFSRK